MHRSACLVLALTLLGGCRSADDPGPPPAVSLNARTYEQAFRELTDRLAAESAKGWAAHVATTGEPPRPHLRLGKITNQSAVNLDMIDFREQLAQRLVASGQVFVAGDREQPLEEAEMQVGDEQPLEEAEMQEGDAQADPGIMGPAQPEVSFILSGSIHDTTTVEDDVKTHTMIVNLSLLDVSNQTILLQTRTEGSEVLER